MRILQQNVDHFKVIASLLCALAVASALPDDKAAEVEANVLSDFPPDISGIKYMIKNNDVCKMEKGDVDIEMVMCVVSHVGNLERRGYIREAYPESLIRPLGIRRVFVLATLNNGTEPDRTYQSVRQEDILDESKTYGDVVQFDNIESFDSLTFKSLLTLKYASKVCSNAKFLFKADDDLLLNYFKLLEQMLAVKDEDVNNLHGIIWDHMGVVRDEDSKYYVSVDEHPEDEYSQYLSGILYGTSPATARALVEKSKEVNFFHMEDVYVTGRVADAVGVNRSNLVDVWSDKALSVNCCRDLKKKVVYRCEFILALGYEGQNDALTKVSEHEYVCYKTQSCLKLDEKAQKSASLQCF